MSQPYEPRHGGAQSAGLLAPFVTIPAMVLVLLVVVRSFFLQPFAIPSSSMEDTLEVGDRVVVTIPDHRDVRRGDVIVFVDPDHWLGAQGGARSSSLTRVLVTLHLMPEHTGEHLIKRVIGVGGDHVVGGADGSLSVNGVQVREPYVKGAGMAGQRSFDVTVPPGSVWVMGDNRSNSADSRSHRDDAHHGFVPLEDVVGVAKAVVWPREHWQRLDGAATDLGRLPGARAQRENGNEVGPGH